MSNMNPAPRFGIPILRAEALGQETFKTPGAEIDVEARAEDEAGAEFEAGADVEDDYVEALRHATLTGLPFSSFRALVVITNGFLQVR